MNVASTVLHGRPCVDVAEEPKSEHDDVGFVHVGEKNLQSGMVPAINNQVLQDFLDGRAGSKVQRAKLSHSTL